MRIVFLCSGGGGNLRFVAAARNQGWLPDAQISAVLSDRACGAHTFALVNGLHAELMDFSAEGQMALLDKLHGLNPDLIITTVHKVLVPAVVKAFDCKLVNLHYSLLPAFAGVIGDRPVRQALASGAKFVGVTVHLVDDSLDMGRPLIQAVTAVSPEQDFDALMDRLFRSGCLALLQAISMLSPHRQPIAELTQATVMLGGQPVHFNPVVTVPSSLQSDSGWLLPQ